MSFSSDLGRFTIKAETAIEETRRAICIELFSSVILDSPVDTGRFRGNWQTSVRAPKTGEINRLDVTGKEAISEIIGNLGALGDSVFLSNNLPYAYRLEFEGWSRKSPQGMVRRNVARIQRIVDKAASENKI